MKKIFLISIFCFSLSAQELIDYTQTSTGEVDAGLIFSSSKIEYDTQQGDLEIKRDLLGLHFNIGKEDLNFILGAGFLTNSKIDNSSNDGDGYKLSAGLKSELGHAGPVVLHAYGLYNFLKDTYDFNYETNIHELSLGLVSQYNLNTFSFYTGLELTPYENSEYDSGFSKFDLERNRSFGLKFGIKKDFQNFYLRSQLDLLNQSSLLFNLGFDF